VPYDLSTTISVPNGNTLTIAAGDTIRFLDSYYLNIYGTLIAEGTSSEHIVITKAPTFAGYWQYLLFNDPDNVCELTYCDISYGGNNYGNIYAYSVDNKLNISNCRIKYSNSAGIFLDHNSNPSIKNCIITGNNTYGINAYGQSRDNCPTFGNDSSEWNDIYNNGSYNLYNGIEDIFAYYVYWGFSDSYNIGLHIYDHHDDNTLGYVNYNPWENNIHYQLPPNEHAGLISSSSPSDQLNWTLANGSIHYVTGTVTIDSGVTVTIEDGVKVRFTEGTYIEVNGNLTANGSSGITFTNSLHTICRFFPSRK
jgi:hypothetical protein